MSDKNKSLKQILVDFIQHNPRHYVTLKIFGRQIHPCARCLGLWFGLLVGFILSSIFWLGIYQIKNFILVFLIAWAFALPAIFDWISIKSNLRKGNNKTRLLTGFLLGIGIVIYFFVLPADIIFKVVTYSIYEIIFYIIRWYNHIRHYTIKK